MFWAVNAYEDDKLHSKEKEKKMHYARGYEKRTRPGTQVPRGKFAITQIPVAPSRHSEFARRIYS